MLVLVWGGKKKEVLLATWWVVRAGVHESDMMPVEPRMLAVAEGKRRGDIGEKRVCEARCEDMRRSRRSGLTRRWSTGAEPGEVW